jgi:hypothetical protein
VCELVVGDIRRGMGRSRTGEMVMVVAGEDAEDGRRCGGVEQMVRGVEETGVRW